MQGTSAHTVAALAAFAGFLPAAAITFRETEAHGNKMPLGMVKPMKPWADTKRGARKAWAWKSGKPPSKRTKKGAPNPRYLAYVLLLGAEKMYNRAQAGARGLRFIDVYARAAAGSGDHK